MEPSVATPTPTPAPIPPIASGHTGTGAMFIGLIVGLIVGGAGGWYIGYMLKLTEQPQRQISDVGEAQIQADAMLADPSENPLGDLSTNPYEDVKVNPFE